MEAAARYPTWGPHVRVVATGAKATNRDAARIQYPTRMADGIPFFGVLVISEAVKGENVEITWDHQSCRIWESRVQQLSTPIPILQNMRERFAGVWLLTERCGTVLLAQFGRVTTIACVLCQLPGEFVLGRGTPIRKEGDDASKKAPDPGSDPSRTGFLTFLDLSLRSHVLI